MLIKTIPTSFNVFFLIIPVLPAIDYSTIFLLTQIRQASLLLPWILRPKCKHKTLFITTLILINRKFEHFHQNRFRHLISCSHLHINCEDF